MKITYNAEGKIVFDFEGATLNVETPNDSFSMDELFNYDAVAEAKNVNFRFADASSVAIAPTPPIDEDELWYQVSKMIVQCDNICEPIMGFGDIEYSRKAFEEDKAVDDDWTYPAVAKKIINLVKNGKLHESAETGGRADQG